MTVKKFPSKGKRKTRGSFEGGGKKSTGNRLVGNYSYTKRKS